MLCRADSRAAAEAGRYRQARSEAVLVDRTRAAMIMRSPSPKLQMVESDRPLARDALARLTLRNHLEIFMKTPSSSVVARLTYYPTAAP